MESKWKKFLVGDKLDKEFVLILAVVFCSLWLGAMLSLLDYIKNLLIIAGNIDPGKVVLYAPLLSRTINIMFLWDIASITIMVAYLLALLCIFYYVKGRMSG